MFVVVKTCCLCLLFWLIDFGFVACIFIGFLLSIFGFIRIYLSVRLPLTLRLILDSTLSAIRRLVALDLFLFLCRTSLSRVHSLCALRFGVRPGISCIFCLAFCSTTSASFPQRLVTHHHVSQNLL